MGVDLDLSHKYNNTQQNINALNFFTVLRGNFCVHKTGDIHEGLESSDISSKVT